MASSSLPARVDSRAAGSPGVHAALSVIEHIVTHGAIGLGDLARALDLPKSTLHRICTVLVERGWAVRDERGRFEPGLRALAIGSRTSDLPIVTGFRQAVAPLVAAHDETVCLAVLDGADSVFIAIEETSQPVRLMTWVGRRAPAFASASGRVLLAGWAPGAVAALLDGQPLVTPTGRPVGGMDELQAMLDGIRAAGYAENEEDTADGLWTASVPIVNGAGEALAAVTLCVPTSRAGAGRRRVLVRDLQAAGRALARDAAWLPSFYAKRV